MDKVLVVGANGFVGSAIVRALMASESLLPVAGVRHRHRHATDGIEQRICDATNAASLAKAMDGIAYVVNCVLGDSRTMLQATRNTCMATARAGVRGAVQISTMSVYGPAQGSVDEEAPLDGSLGWYGAAKVSCEEVAHHFIAGGAPIAVVRPGIVYGPGGEQWIGRIGRMLLSGRIGDLGPAGDGICNLIHKDDVADAVIEILQHGKAWGHAFNLADPEPGTWNDFFLDLSTALAMRQLRVTPAWRLLAEARIAGAPLHVARGIMQRLGIVPAFVPEPITSSLMRLWRQRIWLDPRKTDALLRMRRTPRDAGLELAAHWFLAVHGRKMLPAAGLVLESST